MSAQDFLNPRGFGQPDENRSSARRSRIPTVILLKECLNTVPQPSVDHNNAGGLLKYLVDRMILL